MNEQNLTISELYSLLKESMAKQTEEINKNIADNIQKLAGKFEKVNIEISELQSRSLRLDRKVRENNIVVYGLDLEQGENILEKALVTLNNLLDVNLQEKDINNIYLLGKENKPPLKIEFISYLKKISLFRDKDKLKALKQKSIVIANDLCYEDREIQKKLRAHLKQVRERNLDARIRGNKLVIGSKAYSLNELEESEVTEGSNSESEEGVEYLEGSQERPAVSKVKGKSVCERIPAGAGNMQKGKNIKAPNPKSIPNTRSHKRAK